MVNICLLGYSKMRDGVSFLKETFQPVFSLSHAVSCLDLGGGRQHHLTLRMAGDLLE